MRWVAEVTGSELKLMLDALGVGPKELALALGYSESAVWKWVHRNTHVPAEAVPRITSHLKKALKAQQKRHRIVIEVLARL